MIMLMMMMMLMKMMMSPLSFWPNLSITSQRLRQHPIQTIRALGPMPDHQSQRTHQHPVPDYQSPGTEHAHVLWSCPMPPHHDGSEAASLAGLWDAVHIGNTFAAIMTDHEPPRTGIAISRFATILEQAIYHYGQKRLKEIFISWRAICSSM